MTRSKYNATRTTVEGITFASKREAARYQALRLLEKAGEIKHLELQPKFPLSVCALLNGELHQVCTYIADFQYHDRTRGVLVIEDSKGVRTPTYKLKRKMTEAQYGITITEV